MVVARELTPKKHKRGLNNRDENTLNNNISKSDAGSIYSNTSTKSWKSFLRGEPSALRLNYDEVSSTGVKRKKRDSIKKIFYWKKHHDYDEELAFDHSEDILTATCLTSSSRYSSICSDSIKPCHPQLESLIKSCPPKGTLEFIMENGLPRGCEIQSGIMEYWSLYND